MSDISYNNCIARVTLRTEAMKKILILGHSAPEYLGELAREGFEIVPLSLDYRIPQASIKAIWHLCQMKPEDYSAIVMPYDSENSWKYAVQVPMAMKNKLLIVDHQLLSFSQRWKYEVANVSHFASQADAVSYLREHILNL